MSEEQVVGLVLTAALVLVAVTFAVLARSVSRGTLARNRFVGLRLPSTLASDAAWDAGHRAALPAMRLTAAVAGVLAVPTAGLTLGEPDAAFVVGLGGIALVVALSLAGAVVAHRAARAA